VNSTIYDGYRVLRRLLTVSPEALSQDELSDLSRGLNWAIYTGLALTCGCNIYLTTQGRQALSEATDLPTCDETAWIALHRANTTTHRAPCAIPRYGVPTGTIPDTEALCDIGAYADRIGRPAAQVVEALLSGALSQCDQCGAIRAAGVGCCAERQVKPCQR
jgi:hypothetical protein